LLYRNIHLRPATSKDAIIKLFDDIPSQVRDLITSEAERIKQMSDELGQSALLECVSDVRGFKAAGSDYDRTVWAFLHEADNFKKAEAIHHADYNRYGIMWSGFAIPSGNNIALDKINKSAFEDRIKDSFTSNSNILVEVFTRTKLDDETGEEYTVYQLSIYREGLPKSELVFNDDKKLDQQTWKPVFESVITYEPDNGAIDVVSKGKKTHQELADIFVDVFIEQPVVAEKVPMRVYDISKLLKTFDFLTDPEDGIEKTVITSITLREVDSKRHVIVGIPRNDAQTVYEIADAWFKQHNPLLGGFTVHQVKLVVCFYPEENQRRYPFHHHWSQWLQP
jgi:hypothetical protein